MLIVADLDGVLPHGAFGLRQQSSRRFRPAAARIFAMHKSY